MLVWGRAPRPSSRAKPGFTSSLSTGTTTRVGTIIALETQPGASDKPQAGFP
jgi:hypothetical protein